METFDKFYAPAIGRIMLGLAHNQATFDFSRVSVRDYNQAFTLVKLSTSYSEKIVYALEFLGKFNRVATQGVNKFISILFGEEEKLYGSA